MFWPQPRVVFAILRKKRTWRLGCAVRGEEGLAQLGEDLRVANSFTEFIHPVSYAVYVFAGLVSDALDLVLHGAAYPVSGFFAVAGLRL